jgi:branched-subunit amino acid transport protein
MWIAVLLVGAGTLALRLVPLTVGGRVLGSARGQRLASLGGTAALAALVAGALTGPAAERPGGLPAVAAALAAGALAARRGLGLAAVSALGLATYWTTLALTGPS